MKIKKTPKEILKTLWGYDNFKPLQEEIINSIVSWKDTLAILSTGYWKSICYQISSQIFDGLTIIISPLLSLMEDQVDNIDKFNEINELKSKGIQAIYLNSLLTKEEKTKNISRILAWEIKLLYISPEKFCSKSFIDLLKDIPISQIVIDEAHCIKLYWDSWFRKSYKELGDYIEKLKDINKKIVISAFTGTATTSTINIIKEVLRMKSPKEFKSNSIRENFYIYTSYEDSKKIAEEKLIRLCLSLKDIEGKILIFPGTIKATKTISSLLKTAKLESAHFYAWLSATRKKSLQKKFKEGDLKFLIATSAFWMWVDIPDIRVVIHFCAPLDMESYVQEIWRAWRDWKETLAVLLTCSKDVASSRFMINWKENKIEAMKEFELFLDYIKSNYCKQNLIEKYFNKKSSLDCLKCNSCNW